MTPTEAVNKVLSENNNLKAQSCKDYGTDYLVTAYENDDDMDPFYLVNKRTGSIRNYTIAENPSRYYSTPDVKY